MGRRLVAGVVGILLLGLWGCNQGTGQAQGTRPVADGHNGPAPQHEKAGTDPHDEAMPPRDPEGAAPHSHGADGTAAPAAGRVEDPGSIVLSAEARANIGLQTVPAELRTIERTLVLNATLKVDPDHEAFVSSRVQGKATAVRANVGDRVAHGQVLVAIQSFQIAEIPPTVEVPSPLTGVVLERSVTVGETIDPAKQLFHVADLTHLLAEAEVYETDLGAVRRRQAARVRVASFPDRVFTGRVVRLADAIEPDRRTLRIWIEVLNTPDLKLKPEMFAQVNLIVASSGATVAVPNEAVQAQGPERFVFVQNGNDFVRQNVLIGERDDRYTAIRSGVVEGDEVVTRGAVELATLSSQPVGGGVQDESKPHAH